MKQYAYQGKIWVGPLNMIFFGGIGYFLFTMAWDRKDFDFKGLHYTGDAAFYIHSCLTALSIMLCLMGVVIVFQRFCGEPKILEVTPLDFTIPRLLFIDKTTIRFADIVDVTEQRVNKSTVLTIRTPYQKGVISSVNFEKKEFYEDVRAMILEKAPLPRNA